MKIGIVCYPTFGGSGVVATELGKSLALNGHEVHFVTYDQPHRLEFFNENIFYHEVDIYSYPLFQHAPYELALASKLVNVVINEGLELLHVHYAIPHAAAGWLAQQILESKGINIPMITTLHGTDITLVGKNTSFEPVVTFSINRSNGVTTVSESLKKDTYESFEIHKPIEVIPNFIDLSRFKKQKKDHFKKAICPNGEFLIVHTSNFRKVKRVDDVIHIFAKIKQNLPAKLLMAGDGPERAKAEALCRELDVWHDVRFLGKLDAVEEVLSVADLFLMPSETESFGLAALEAMACEVPVISTNTGGLPELNIQAKTGFLSEVGDIEQMVRHALFVLNPDNLPSFKANALARAQEFDIERIRPKYEAYYHQILSNNRK